MVSIACGPEIILMMREYEERDAASAAISERRKSFYLRIPFGQTSGRDAGSEKRLQRRANERQVK